jgi:hypothetical protein
VLTWRPVDRTGQSVEGFRDAGGSNGDGFLAGRVVCYGDGWRAYAGGRAVDGGPWATAKAAQQAVEAHLDASGG